MSILFLLSYLVVLQPRVNAAEEILAIQNEINSIQMEMNSLNESISWHQFQYKNAIKEKDYCITQCTFSWDSQAALEHSGAEADRMNLEKNQIRLDNLNKRLGLLMERQLQ